MTPALMFNLTFILVLLLLDNDVNDEWRHLVLGFEAGKTLFTWTGEDESGNRSQGGGNIFFAPMITLIIRSRLNGI